VAPGNAREMVDDIVTSTSTLGTLGSITGTLYQGYPYTDHSCGLP